MLGLISGLVGGALSPLIDRLTAISARFIKKLALFVVAAICLVVVLIALTIAFDLWIATFAGPIAGALAVALLYFVVAAVAVLLAMRDGRPSEQAAPSDGSAAATPERDDQIDRFTTPLMTLLGQLGLRREQLAVLAGGSIAKKIGPIPLVGLAIVAGFLIGRTWKMWRNLLTAETLASLLAMASVFGFGSPAADEHDDT